MVEGARLEIVYTLIAYREFESLPLRHPPTLRHSARRDVELGVYAEALA